MFCHVTNRESCLLANDMQYCYWHALLMAIQWSILKYASKRSQLLSTPVHRELIILRYDTTKGLNRKAISRKQKGHQVLVLTRWQTSSNKAVYNWNIFNDFKIHITFYYRPSFLMIFKKLTNVPFCFSLICFNKLFSFTCVSIVIVS